MAIFFVKQSLLSPEQSKGCLLYTSIDGGEIRIHVAGVAAPAGHLLARGGNLAQRVGIVLSLIHIYLDDAVRALSEIMPKMLRLA